MANIAFYAGEGNNIRHMGGSGIGFYGSNFGFSVQVGSYQDTSFITDSTGAVENIQIDNNKWASSSGVSINGGSENHLQELPNRLSTLNIRFTHSSSVKTQNAILYGHDRGNKNLEPSGLVFKAAEIIHPETTNSFTGSGDGSWTELKGSGQTLDLVASPGTSGLSPNGQNTDDTRHDWYVALSPSPQKAGSKEFALTVDLEFV